ncbi:unnamed protein product [Rotaria magnacalcarata]|uniref:U-box domain-containing protein n=1 Tax=Rotaria magnacalcarata TaxID=392030 RepID=A0A819GGB5_9BILA|nr:unnamed protein product [Rotaria magnacalcarata]CAF2171450.1 unnamed protein product [Rotaria magnacalcarata]CAF3879360.1 unnamed protein product [Rotaria magnacalcarata]CAF4302091.1 unnamed protein product [Rotaria magnacalcarata]
MEASMQSIAENDDLICPITLELYRDPVIAADGHIYEREAITKWILENGTSPFSRQPLSVENLQPDNYLRRLAAQRRNSATSCNANKNVLNPLSFSQVAQLSISSERERPIATSVKSTSTRTRCIIIMAIIIVAIFISLVTGLSLASHSNGSNDSTSRVTTGS